MHGECHRGPVVQELSANERSGHIGVFLPWRKKPLPRPEPPKPDGGIEGELAQLHHLTDRLLELPGDFRQVPEQGPGAPSDLRSGLPAPPCRLGVLSELTA